MSDKNVILSPDIQTGRNVYVNEDLYQNDPEYKAKIDSYVKEGFMLVYGTPDDPSVPGGGGGSSDFSTATMTIDGENYSDNVLIGVAYTSPDGSWGSPLESASGDSLTVILYQGKACVTLESDASFTTSGDIEFVEEPTYLVTGDCTITIS